MIFDLDYSHREHGLDVSIWQLSGRADARSWATLLDDAHRFLLELERRGKRMAVIIDPSDLEPIDAGLRRDSGLWRAEHMALIANVVPCASYVAQNAWIRGAISAIFWIAPPIVPVGLKPSLDEALHWVELEMAQHLGRTEGR